MNSNILRALVRKNEFCNREPNLPPDERSEAPLVERVYDIVLAPERLEGLLDAWSHRLGAVSDMQELGILAGAGLLPHVERAEYVLRNLIDSTQGAPAAPLAWVKARNNAAIAVSRAGRVLAANDAAQAILGVIAGDELAALGLQPEDRAWLGREIETFNAAKGGEPRLIRLRLANSGSPIVMTLVDYGAADGVGVATTIVSWPSGLTNMLRRAFSLTDAETEVLKELTLGQSVKDIAAQSGRSTGTIRSHVKMLLQKTAANNQMELIRLTLGLLDVVQLSRPRAGAGGRAGADSGNVYHRAPLPDGRHMDYLAIGPAHGRAFFLMPSGLGLTRLPPAGERSLFERGLRMIAPIRAGYGGSSPLPQGRHVYDVVTADITALMSQLGLARAPFVAFCDDLHMTVEIAARAPGRVSAIVGCGATMPNVHHGHFARMSKFTRFIHANARYAPQALPYVALAFFSLARRVGQRRFMQIVMKDSPPDLALLADEEVWDAIARGSEVTMAPGFSAHEAWAVEVIANHALDWSAALHACRAPITLLAGHLDPFSPIETVREFANANDGIELLEFPEDGQLMYRRLDTVFDVLDRHFCSQTSTI
jgi:DNA-binding CsgD family transcriptional regulator/pimeloyl-ACP methyl ester carboxylesterase